MRAKYKKLGGSSIYTDVYRRLFVKKHFFMRCSFAQLFVEQLLDISRVFEADLQSVVVLAIIEHMEIEARTGSRLDASGSTPTGLVMGRPPRINTSSISAASGIPRETVRRKLAALARRGWIERGVDGFWRITTDRPDSVPARPETIEIDRRQVERVCRYLGQMHALAVEAQPRKPSAPERR